MRVVVVSPETIHHRDADDTRRLQRLLRGLADRGHDVTVCCARWWDADVEGDAATAGRSSAAADLDDGSAVEADPAADDAGPTRTDGSDDRLADGGDETEDDGEVDDGASRAEEDENGGDDGDEAEDDESEAGDAESTASVAPAPGVADAESATRPSAATATDPDDLPPAGNPAAGTAAGPGSAGGPASGGRGPTAPDESEASGRAPKTVTVDGITYRSVVADPAETRAFATRAPLAVRRASPDVIHAVATPPATVLAARVGATLSRAPLLAEWYDPSRDSTDDWTTRQALQRAPRIVTPSRLTRRQLLEHGADDASLRVVPNAIDVEQIRSVEPEDGAADVVYARRLDADANLESLFLGLAELRDREWSATIVGDGPERTTYEQQARDLRIDDRVTFVGACDREDRLAIYRGAHAFVQTARHCVFATELLWALACGCVGIVEYHAASSAHELVEGRDRGFRTTNPQETAQAILDAGDLERLTVDDSFASFDESPVLDQYEELYDQVREERGLF